MAKEKIGMKRLSQPSTILLAMVASAINPASAQDGLECKQVAPVRQDAPATAEGHRWAVVVGVNEYEDETIPTLRCCVADAKLMVERLTGRCGYEPERVLLLADDQPVHRQPRKAILQRQMQAWLMRAQPGDTV